MLRTTTVAYEAECILGPFMKLESMAIGFLMISTFRS